MDGPSLALFLMLLATGLSLGEAYKTFYLERECWKGFATLDLSGYGSDSSALVWATTQTSYSMQLQCRLLVTAPARHRITLSVREIDFRTTSWGKACVDYVQIKNLNYCRKVYNENEEQHFNSIDNTFDVFYSTTGDDAALSGFAGLQFTVTAYRIGVEANGSFECSNGHLVWNYLTCDGHNNCGDLSDEEVKGPSFCRGEPQDEGTPSTLILVLVLSAVHIVLLVAVVLCAKNERVRGFFSSAWTRTLSLMRGRGTTPTPEHINIT